MATVIFLAICAAVWHPYGLFCFANPGFLAEAAGVSAASTTGTIELRAMYGGLQAGIGTLALAAIWRETLRRPALVSIVFLCGGLALARLLGAAVAAELSGYTIMGLFLEVGSVAFAAAVLRSGEPSPA